LIDLDPGSRTVTARFGLLNSREDIRAVCMGRISVEGAIHRVDPLVAVIPTSSEFEELDRSEELDFEPIFRRLWELNEYPVILVDLPPGRSDFVHESLIYGDWVLLPTRVDLDSVRTIQATERVVGEAKRFNGQLRWLGILVTMYKSQTINSKIMLQQLKERYEGKIRVLNTILPSATIVSESALYQTDTVTYAPASKAGRKYIELAEEVLGILEITA